MTDGAVEHQERRLEPRYIIEFPVLLVWGVEKYEGTMRNLSERGLYITLEPRAKELQVEDRVEVILQELEQTHEATICRIDNYEDAKEPVGLGLILTDYIDILPICDRYL